MARLAFRIGARGVLARIGLSGVTILSSSSGMRPLIEMADDVGNDESLGTMAQNKLAMAPWRHRIERRAERGGSGSCNDTILPSQYPGIVDRHMEEGHVDQQQRKGKLFPRNGIEGKQSEVQSH